MKQVLSQLKQYKKPTCLCILMAALEVMMEILLPFVTARIVDEGLEAANIGAVYRYGAVMVALAFLGLFFGAAAGRFASTAASGLSANLRQALYDNIQTFSFSNIDKFSVPGLVTRMTTDVTNIQSAFMMIIRVAVRAPLMFVFSFAMCVYISPRLSATFLIAVVFLVAAIGAIMVVTLRIFDQVFHKYDELNASVQENVSAIRVVKAFVREDYENEKFTKASENIRRMFVKAEGLLAFNNPAMMIAVYFCIIMVSWLGAQFIVAGDLSTGDLTSLFSYIMSLLMSLMMLSMVVVMIAISLASVHRVGEVLRETPDLAEPEDPITVIPDGSVDFDHVNFSYKHGSGKNALSDIDLHIRSGETIGVIGGTGSGKSSLVNLICRLYDVDGGCVKVGGVDVRRCDMEALRDQVAVVLQKNTLFSGTILENLRWGDPDATEEECVEACRAACADEFIDRMPDGYNTRIERGGANVSGGQKQRLCIARALLKKPKVLILDDSTSAVDTATDAKIRAAFEKKIPGTTKIIIAQRVSSVEHADRILVLDNGRINGFDTHENLLKTNAIYQEIYESQVKGGGDFDQPA
ncbi:ABC transporter ATP-binding protein [Candidatus Allofournierella excrementigallinarum]|uniref:ABC transporter ATP-binding protein n=1 Tax=Candidatus Allofournierella excrementigallinarum TaxID=2838592 RepID=UPI00374F97C7